MFDYNFPTNKREYYKQPNIYEKNMDIPSYVFDSYVSEDISAEVEMALTGNIYDMRHEHKRIVKKIMKLYANKEPELPLHEANQFTRRRALIKNGAV